MKTLSASPLKPLVLTALAALALSAQAADAVKVGLLSTLSSPGAGLGIDIRDGFQLAVEPTAPRSPRCARPSPTRSRSSCRAAWASTSSSSSWARVCRRT